MQNICYLKKAVRVFFLGNIQHDIYFGLFLFRLRELCACLCV